MKKVVGKVTDNEKKAIMEINSHKNSLEELLHILSPDDDIYEKAKTDLSNTLLRYHNWWNGGYAKYHWEKGTKDWSIIFETNEIIIDC